MFTVKVILQTPEAEGDLDMQQLFFWMA